MTAERTFAPWVAPIAAQIREGRGQVIRAAQQMLPEQWRMPSPLPGWSYQDVLAHLAVGDWVCQTVLRAATANERLDMAAIADLDGTNERYRQERAGRSVEELLVEVEEEGEETQELLSRLTEDDKELRQEDIPMSLGEGLARDPGGHDREHLAQLRQALDSVML